MAGLYDQINQNLNFVSDNDMFTQAYAWEPKKKHQFIMYVGTNTIPSHLIKASAKPTLQQNEVTLDMINVQRYVKGKSVWNTIDITLYDPIVPSAAQSVIEWVRLHHESATGRDGYASFYKKDIYLHQLSPLGEVIEEWILKGTFITQANFGDLDWSTDDAQNIQMTLRYDWAFLNY